MEKTTRSRNKLTPKSSQKPLEREFSAGGVVYKKGKGVQFLIIRPKDTDRWQLPKGQIDKGESAKETAKREVEEEGAVKTEVLEKLGDTKYFYVFKGRKIFKVVTFYLMKYKGFSKKGIDKKEIDEARFVSFDEAKEKLTFRDDKKMVGKAKEILDSGI